MAGPAPDGVAILGFGSLIWDLDDLAPKVSGAWLRGAGPRLPVEFSRVSPKRRNGLALVIDLSAGAWVPTHVIRHAAFAPGDGAAALARAQADLAARERTTLERIGWARRDGQSSRPEDAATEAIRNWLAASPYAAVVWTDLASNFAEAVGRPFDLAAAEAHLLSLAGEDRAEAVRYIHRAPAETDTPLRRRLAERAWWREAVASLGAAG